jgi:hypothetical protein
MRGASNEGRGPWRCQLAPRAQSKASIFPAVPREPRTGFEKGIRALSAGRQGCEGDESGTGDGASTVRGRAPRGRIWARCLAHGPPSVLYCLILRRPGS